ncbi:hypothetical protein LC612_41280 [Nostoc sp. CHAB 5834]|nr:hypothetical protein [Nostoc sp. CHAB 5834]
MRLIDGKIQANTWFQRITNIPLSAKESIKMDETQDSDEFKAAARVMHHSKEIQSETYEKILKGALGQDSNLQENISDELEVAAKAMHHSTEMQLEVYEKY